MFLMEDAGKMSIRGATFCGLLGPCTPSQPPLKKFSIPTHLFFFHIKPKTTNSNHRQPDTTSLLGWRFRCVCRENAQPTLKPSSRGPLRARFHDAVTT